MYIQAAFNHNTPSPPNPGIPAQPVRKNSAITELCLLQPGPGWAHSPLQPGAASGLCTALPQPWHPAGHLEAAVELQVVGKAWQGHTTLTHSLWSSVQLLCQRTQAQLELLTLIRSGKAQPSAQRQNLCFHQHNIPRGRCTGKGIKTLVHFMQCEQSTEIHLGMKVEMCPEYLKPAKKPPRLSLSCGYTALGL